MSKVNSVFKSLRRSPYQSFAAFTMTSVTFFVVTIFTLLVFGTHEILVHFESQPQVTAFFKDQLTETQVKLLKDKLQATSYIKSLNYISQTDALKIYQQQNQDNPLLLEMVTADILPPSLEVSAHRVSDLPELAQILEAEPEVEEVIYQKDVVDSLKKWVHGLRIGGLALTLLLLLGSLLTLVIILGMRVSSRRTEIKTLSLLGASSWYIKKSFLIEGIIYCFVGAVIGWGFTYLLLLYLTPNLLDFFSGISLLPISIVFMVWLLGAELLGAVVLGFLASFSATRRYA